MRKNPSENANLVTLTKKILTKFSEKPYFCNSVTNNKGIHTSLDKNSQPSTFLP